MSVMVGGEEDDRHSGSKTPKVLYPLTHSSLPRAGVRVVSSSVSEGEVNDDDGGTSLAEEMRACAQLKRMAYAIAKAWRLKFCASMR